MKAISSSRVVLPNSCRIVIKYCTKQSITTKIKQLTHGFLLGNNYKIMNRLIYLIKITTALKNTNLCKLLRVFRTRGFRCTIAIVKAWLHEAFYSFHCLSFPFLRDADWRKGTLCPFCVPIHKKKKKKKKNIW